MTDTARAALITRTLTESFQPQSLALEDESHLHHGHVGATTGKGHFRLRIVAEAFTGKTPIARHRMIYNALARLLETDIHALSIEALSPDESAH
jgi:stress-induced morphogen